MGRAAREQPEDDLGDILEDVLRLADEVQRMGQMGVAVGLRSTVAMHQAYVDQQEGNR